MHLEKKSTEFSIKTQFYYTLYKKEIKSFNKKNLNSFNN